MATLPEAPEALPDAPPSEITSEAREGDVVQVNPTRVRRLGGLLLVVTASSELGVRGMAYVPDKGGNIGRFEFRVMHGDYAVIGRAVWSPL